MSLRICLSTKYFSQEAKCLHRYSVICYAQPRTIWYHSIIVKCLKTPSYS